MSVSVPQSNVLLLTPLEAIRSETDRLLVQAALQISYFWRESETLLKEASQCHILLPPCLFSKHTLED